MAAVRAQEAGDQAECQPRQLSPVARLGFGDQPLFPFPSVSIHDFPPCTWNMHVLTYASRD